MIFAPNNAHDDHQQSCDYQHPIFMPDQDTSKDQEISSAKPNQSYIQFYLQSDIPPPQNSPLQQPKTLKNHNQQHRNSKIQHYSHHYAGHVTHNEKASRHARQAKRRALTGMSTIMQAQQEIDRQYEREDKQIVIKNLKYRQYAQSLANRKSQQQSQHPNKNKHKLKIPGELGKMHMLPPIVFSDPLTIELSEELIRQLPIFSLDGRWTGLVTTSLTVPKLEQVDRAVQPNYKIKQQDSNGVPFDLFATH